MNKIFNKENIINAGWLTFYLILYWFGASYTHIKGIEKGFENGVDRTLDTVNTMITEHHRLDSIAEGKVVTKLKIDYLKNHKRDTVTWYFSTKTIKQK